MGQSILNIENEIADAKEKEREEQKKIEKFLDWKHCDASEWENGFP